VGLPDAGRAADEEGVVPVGGLVGDVERRRVGELVRLPDDEVLERVGGVEVADAGAIRLRPGRGDDGPGVVPPLEDETDLAGAEAGEAGGLGDLVPVFARDVVDEERAGDEDEDGVRRLALLPRAAEPGVEVALVDPDLQVLEDLSQEVGFSTASPPQDREGPPGGAGRMLARPVGGTAPGAGPGGRARGTAG
jgi:hypothetical protein